MAPSGTISVVDGKYQLVRLLGEGGMGAVHEARHLGTGRRVAVKVIATEALAASEGIVGRFQREARASGAIESEHIAQVLDTGVDPATGQPYMVMEFLAGEDLQGALTRLGGPLVPDVALRVTLQACLGLQKAHDAGVVHRDIKTANIFLARRDGGHMVTKLLDFGIAKMRADPLTSTDDAGLTRTGSLLGSPRYMSPEQARGRKTIDHRSDIWSLGVVLYEMLTGVTPHQKVDTLGELVFQICAEPARLVQEEAPWVAPEVAAIVHRAIALEPDDRFPTAAAMCEAIEKLLPGGYALHESMFVTPSGDARSTIAPRLSRSVQGSTTVAVTGSRATSHGPPRALRPSLLLAGAGTLALAAVGFGIWSRSHPVPTTVDPHPAPSTSLLASAKESAPTAVPPPVAPVPTAASTVVRVAISPPGAHVQIDGHDAPVDPTRGSVEIDGRLGSSHRVHVVDGRRTTDVDVVIAEGGAIPSKVELVDPPAAVLTSKSAHAPKPPPGAKPPPAPNPPAHDIF